MNELDKKILAAKRAIIRINGIDVGQLDMLASDEFRFRYFKEYYEGQPAKPALSLVMPLRAEPYLSTTLHPFFDNLLFEGSQLRIAEKQYGLSHQSPVDRFKLLMITGQNTVSTVKVFPYVDEKPYDLSLAASSSLLSDTKIYPLESAYKEFCAVCLNPLDDKEHIRCKHSLWNSKASIGIESFREDPINIFNTIVYGQSISGAQRKALFHLNRKKVLQKQGEVTHILKPEGDFPEMPANEHLTMAIARELGFVVPPAGLYKCEDIGLIYVIKRFDQDKSGHFFMVEDMAQLSNELAEHKTASTLEHVAKLIEFYATSPKIELAEFFKRLLFCFLIGNGDMHLKNWSLATEPQSGLTKLSPLYDYLNVRASFPQEQVEMVLPLQGKTNKLTKQDFIQFAETSLELNANYIKILFSMIPKWVQIIQDFCPRSQLSAERKLRYLKIVNERARILIGQN